MTVPETAVYEDDGLMSGKHDVRASGKVPVVQRKAVPHRMQQFPDLDLGLGIAAPDPGHEPAAF